LEIDDYLISHYLREFPDVGDRGLLGSRGGLSYLLLRPKRYLQRLWREVLSAQIDQLDEGVQYLFLSMHAAFYSNQSREFFSPVQADYLAAELGRKGFCIERVVTLLDDIFDVFRHLVRPGQLFAFSERATSQQKAVEAILNLHLALDWRSIEIFHAGEIARALKLKKEHVLLAVKHPLAVAFDIALARKPMMYIAHPIKDVRQTEIEGEIEDLANSVRRADFAVPVCPTSIDELVVERAMVDEREVFRPRLGPRWRFGRPEELLFVPPEDADLNPLDPDGVFSDGEDPLLAGLLYSLLQAIGDQVNARDRALVEQSSGIMAWRPFFNGDMSSGVAQEIMHRNSLISHGILREREKKCFIYGPPSDLGRWRIGQLVETLKREAVGRNGARLADGVLRQVRSVLGSNKQLMSAFADGTVRHGDVKTAVAALIPQLWLTSGNEWGTLEGTRGVVERQREDQRWQDLLRSILERSPLEGLRRDGDLYVEEKMTVDEFVARVQDEWTRPVP
jgi:hypothetical protein